jgi:nickel-dependent lactate racemase
MVIGTGYTDRFLTEEEARDIFSEALGTLPISDKRVLVIIPDSTRSGPIPMVFRVVTDLLRDRVRVLDFLIALGTHKGMTPDEISRHVGVPCDADGTFAGVRVYNHDFVNDVTKIGTIPAPRIKELSGGLMEQDVDVTVNKRLFDYDQIIICGPVFPHEVAGYSGGLKYFFPGVSGADVTNFTHWLGAVITNVKIIGTPRTPVREVIEEAASFIHVPTYACCMVVRGHHDLAGLFCGEPKEAQAAAADLSSHTHVVWVDHPYKTVLSVMPELYDDIWTAAKGMYKMEPVVADGGTVIIYAPHIDEVSYTHGKVLDRIGYHVRDYFLKQMDRFADVPGGVMAHSTHVKGAGTYENGVETPRINVVLATRIPKERCDQINLGYMDPAEIDVDEWTARQNEDLLVVPRAGEMLYRLKSER